MKKTFTINISGRVFHIEEDAYEKLQEYLKKLNLYFEGQTGGQEILQDIEARIAELLQQKIDEGNEAVTAGWVDDLIHRMGNPEDFMDEEAASVAQPKQEAKTGKTKKRLYRDGESRVLGGVCSGMSAYFNIDPVILRVVFLLLVFVGVGVSAIVYLVLWIVVPKARTTAQRLEMKGVEATISNIQKTVQEEVTEMKESFNGFTRSETFQKGKSAAGKASATVARGLGRLVAAVFGAILILVGFGGFVAMMVSMAVGNSLMHASTSGLASDVNFSGMVGYIVNPGLVSVMILLAVLIIGIPLLAIFFIGTKLVFRYKTNNRAIGLGAFGVWLVSLVLLTVLGVGQISNFSKKNSVSDAKPINCANCQTLYVELNDVDGLDDTGKNVRFDEFSLIRKGNVNLIAGNPELEIEATDSPDFSVIVRKQARGKSMAEVQQNIDHIDYQLVSRDSTLVLDRFFTLAENDKWRNQELEVVIRVPRGKSVHLGDKLDLLHFGFDNVNNMWPGEMTGKTWSMTPEGLSLAK